ncbi:unnamed protein product [Spirodela intermedia]|uniref:Uncharacterized protein n=1 Tax=Spirodela intermedia TaxID=51605 RepID=A0A7I8J4V9_SPIIN|nr:unnamed protein product [Spirodela intermedia]CAA6665266.1 unnamed protein product [Spirodela intermedia]
MTSRSGGSSCSVHGLEGSPWTKTTRLRRLSPGGAEKRRLCGSPRLSPDGEELDGGGARVRSFILRSAQQEEALHRIWYALRRSIIFGSS